jgi:plasmid segregation protein ParM
MPRTVRAIDVGYSWTKFVIAGDRVDQIRCRAFPSIAPRASGRDLALDGVSQRQTVQIAVDDLLFEVGPEAALVQETVHALPLDDAYTQTSEYLALVRGALRLMHVSHVDLLVVGLPVALFRPRRQALEERLVGTHPVGGGDGDGRGIVSRNPSGPSCRRRWRTRRLPPARRTRSSSTAGGPWTGW